MQTTISDRKIAIVGTRQMACQAAFIHIHQIAIIASIMSTKTQKIKSESRNRKLQQSPYASTTNPLSFARDRVPTDL
jgi:predicted lipid-binding transport protein (Tim44 family)